MFVMNTRRCIGSLVFSLSLVACGEKGKMMGDDDMMSPDAPNNGEFVQAEHPAQPQLVNQGGTVLATPKVRPVFFANDAATKAQVEDFLTQLQTSSYWTANVAEY